MHLEVCILELDNDEKVEILSNEVLKCKLGYLYFHLTLYLPTVLKKDVNFPIYQFTFI